MVERRSLVEGINSNAKTPQGNPDREKEFIQAARPKPASEPTFPLPAANTATSTAVLSKTPMSTKIRTDFAEALKRASLERQLNKQEPNTLQDILEQAIEPWLRNNGYIR